MKKKPESDDLAAKVSRCLRARAHAKRHFDHADELLAELVHEMEPGQTVKLGKKVVTLVDQFADKLTVYRSHGIKRYDLHVKELP